MERSPHSRKREETSDDHAEATTRYARYLLTSLATVAFGMYLN